MVINRNEPLQRGKREGNDEFYTRIEDIERELQHYEDKFKNKVIFCNCDDPTRSNFWTYFELNFDRLKLKRLISTHYEKSALWDPEPSYKIEITRTPTGKMSKPKKTRLKDDGDFRSPECIELLKEADITVTNPPFTLFKEFIPLLASTNKKFIVVGPYNAVTYKEIFPLIKDNKIWIGTASVKEFITPGGGTKKFGNIIWYTNLNHEKRNEEMVLVKRYKKADYPKYDNFDAIEVSKVKDIPISYKGMMGVPITFLDKYNPDQFEIVGNAGAYAIDGYSLCGALYLDGKKMFKRILIKHKII